MSDLLQEIEFCRRMNRQHQKIADRWAARTRELHKRRSKIEPEQYVTVRIRWPHEQSQEKSQ
jgi:hypothetical protein